MDGIGMNNTLYKKNRIVQKTVGALKKIFPRVTYSVVFGKKNSQELVKAIGDRKKWLDACYKVICSELDGFIKDYHFIPPCRDDCKNIWVCWLQGEEDMPEVVRVCIASIKRNAPKGYSVVLIDNKNLSNFVDIPSKVFELLRAGKLQLNHFSDIVRMKILSEYGGIWIDSTVYVSSPIPDEYFSKRLYSIQAKDALHRYDDIYYGALTSFLIGGSNQCPIFDFLYKFFMAYLEKHWILIDGHWMNIAFRLAYENDIGGVRLDIDSIGVNNANRGSLYFVINKEFDNDIWIELTKNQIFHKLDWRTNYIEKHNTTFFSYIKNNS